jgi:ABC-type microcin C transport system permease subunit YejE
LGVALGRITGPLILGLVFFVVLFPVALLFRLLGKDNLMIKNKYTTTFIPVNKGYAKDDFEKVW